MFAWASVGRCGGRRDEALRFARADIAWADRAVSTLSDLAFELLEENSRAAVIATLVRSLMKLREPAAVNVVAAVALVRMVEAEARGGW